eukprot:c27935_g1_i1 orf=60-1157(+)
MGIRDAAAAMGSLRSDCSAYQPFTMLDTLRSRFRQGPRWFRFDGCRCSTGSVSLATVVKKRSLVGQCAALAAPSEGVSVDSQRVELGFAVGVEVIPHPKKMDKGGEDAYFVSSYNGGVLGIADGVSGWAEVNVDPALFSRELMKHAAAVVDKEEIQNDPQVLLDKAHEATAAIGAATAIIALMEREGILHIASVGDCGLRIIRKGRVVFTTSVQQHYFDCPYQLSSESCGQTSTDAMVYNLPMMKGDTIVMGSDGLFDNVYDGDIEIIVRHFGGTDKESAQRTAKALARLARKHSKDPKYDSPYCQEAISQGYDLPVWKKILGKKLTGGKLDDITVIVVHVVSCQPLTIGASLALCEENYGNRGS